MADKMNIITNLLSVVKCKTAMCCHKRWSDCKHDDCNSCTAQITLKITGCAGIKSYALRLFNSALSASPHCILEENEFVILTCIKPSANKTNPWVSSVKHGKWSPYAYRTNIWKTLWIIYSLMLYVKLKRSP